MPRTSRAASTASTLTTTTSTASGTTSQTSATACLPGSGVSMEHVRYFPRQLITPDDLTQEFEYWRGRYRRLMSYLFGWGIVCGCAVQQAPDAANNPWSAVICPGYILGPQGDEMLIDAPVTVDLSAQDVNGNAATTCGDLADPWCSAIRVTRKPGDMVFLAVAYNECPTRPVRTQPVGCGCDNSQCEYSRLRDGYIVRVLSTLPASYGNIKTPPNRDPFACQSGGVRACPACVTDPWVILAAITLSDTGIATIDNTTYRRNVAAFGGYWFSCA